MGDYLIIGVHSDKQIESYKRTPIFCEKDRYEIMRFDHTVDVGGGRKTIGGALSWRIKDRFRHWAGEEE